jgi:23S rRNA (pseudouridine1915-N3)-methyltransferase
MDMIIKIVSVGSKPSLEISALITDYTKRLPRTVSVSWQYLKHSKLDDVNNSKLQESESILRAINHDDFVLLLDEKGKNLNSNELSDLLFKNNKNIVIIIGGAYGVSDVVSQRANFIWSLSKLVFPHQIVRLILAEQIYRAHTININHPYHHN